MEVLGGLILAALSFIAFILAALGLGRIVLGWANQHYRLELDDTDLLLLGWILGLGVQMFLAGALLLAGAMNQITAWATVAGGVLCAARQRTPILASLRRLFGLKAVIAHLKAHPALAAMLIPAGLFLYYGTLKSCLPLDDWDAISAHMAYAKVWATHGLASFQRLSFLSYPKGVFALYALVIAMGFEPVLLALNIAAVFAATAMLMRVTRIFSPNPYAGAIAAILFISIPAIRVMAYGGKPYLLGNLFELGFLYVALLAIRPKTPAALYAVAGVFGGLAVGSVANAVYTVGLFTPALAIYALATQTLRIKPLLIMIAAVAVVGCPSYMANLIQYGNPVYPMMPGLFGANAWTATPEGDPRLFNSPDLPVSPKGFFMAWAHLFADQPLTRGWGGGFGPVLAAGLVPLCAIWLKRRGLLLTLLAAGAVYSIAWFLGVQVPRGMMMVMALLVIVTGLNVTGLFTLKAPFQSVATSLGAIAVVASASYATIMIQNTTEVSPRTVIIYGQVGREVRLATMFRRLPHRPMPGRLEYETLQFLNTLPAGTRLLAYPVFSGRYYVDTYLDVIPYQSPDGALLDWADKSAATAALKQLGVQYVLFDKAFQEEVASDAWNDPASPGGTIYRFSPLSPLLADPPEDLFEEVFASEHDSEYIYRVR